MYICVYMYIYIYIISTYEQTMAPTFPHFFGLFNFGSTIVEKDEGPILSLCISISLPRPDYLFDPENHFEAGNWEAFVKYGIVLGNNSHLNGQLDNNGNMFMIFAPVQTCS